VTKCSFSEYSKDTGRSEYEQKQSNTDLDQRSEHDDCHNKTVLKSISQSKSEDKSNFSDISARLFQEHEHIGCAW
jgi:hypothetical protein